jgi:ferritin-like metal-binding protein YciE
MRTPEESILKNLQEAIAVEDTFETQLRELASEGDDVRVQGLFAQHADETKNHCERLRRRLEELGGEASISKSFLGHIIRRAPRIAQVWQDTADQSTHNLIMTYAVESSAIAMYEALIATCQEAGDAETEAMVREIQEEERLSAEKVWRHIAQLAKSGYGHEGDVSDASGLTL